MSSAWLYQRPEQVRDLGEDGASCCVGWFEPDGRRKGKAFGPGFRGKKAAERFRAKIEAELMTGTYQIQTKKLWADFRAEYERRILDGLAPDTRTAALIALAHFERIVKPVRVFALSAPQLDDYAARRRQEPSHMRKGEPVSPATVNKELRHIKAALGAAAEWGYLPKVPRVRMEKEPKKLPTYCTPEDFALIYQACEAAARWPEDQPYAAADWWRGLLMTAFLTGWRIGALLALRRADVDLDAGTAVTRATAAGNKGKRDQLIALHPVVIDHLRKLAGFDPCVFPWNHGRRQLFLEFKRIQKAAGMHLAGDRDHYGFHDLRRAFATLNADRLTPDALQALMQHKDYQTTQRYINMARQLNPAVANLYVPDVARKAGG
jgi:integrase